jgi:hypothetical protein
MPHFWHLRTTHCILHKGQEAVQVARMRTTRLPTTPFPLSVAVYVHEFDARRSSLVKSLDRFTWSTHKNAITHTKRGRVLVGMHESVYPARTERTARQSVAGMSLTASVTNFVSHFRGKCGAYFLIHIHTHTLPTTRRGSPPHSSRLPPFYPAPPSADAGAAAVWRTARPRWTYPAAVTRLNEWR